MRSNPHHVSSIQQRSAAHKHNLLLAYRAPTLHLCGTMSTPQQKQALVAGAAVAVAGGLLVAGYLNREKLPALPPAVSSAVNKTTSTVSNTAKTVQSSVSSACTAARDAVAAGCSTASSKAADMYNTVASYLPRQRKLKRVKSFPLVEESLEEEEPVGSKKKKGSPKKVVGVNVTAAAR